MSGEILEGVINAFQLIASGDPVVFGIALRSIQVSGLATLLAMIWSLPLGLLISMRNFPGRDIVKSCFNAAIGIPTVALGLFLYLLLSRTGPFGIFELLYSMTAITIGQSILITPIMVSFTTSAAESIPPEIKELAKTLGASETQASLAVFREALNGILLAVTASFSRATAELGIALMLGGNIRNLTRVLTTTIALETARGELALGIAMAIILLLIVFTVTLAVNLVKRGKI